MKFKKVIFLLLLPFLAEILISCCNCIDPLIQRYSNKTFSIANLDNKGSEPIIATTPSVLKTAYGIRLNVRKEIVAVNQNLNLSVFQTASAASCDCPPELAFLPQDSITAIRIFTLENFDDGHAANTEISDLFKVYKQNRLSKINDFLAAGNRLYNEEEFSSQIDLLLMFPPAHLGKHKFKVQVTLSDGRTLDLETTEIELI